MAENDDKQIKVSEAAEETGCTSAGERRKWAKEKREYRRRKKIRDAEEAAILWNSADSIGEKKAKEVIRAAWNVSNIHVIDTIYGLGIVAAELNRIAPGHFFWTNGPVQSVASVKTGEGLPLSLVQGDEFIDGESGCTRAELFALYQFSIAWREVKGKPISFEEFLRYRYRSKTDCLWFGQFVLDKDFHASPHGVWAETLFVKKIPTLRPGYSQEDVKRWFAKQDDIRKLLLISSRNCYKSSYQIVDNLQWILCCADARLLEISAVKSLSKGFIKTFREYWTVADPRHPSLFAQLFPEMMISAAEQSDSTTFLSPMRRLGLAQATMASSSADSSQVGQRCDVLIFDDIEDEENAATPDLRAKLLEKYELIGKLVEPHGYILTIGTPQAAEGDLYQVVLARSEKNDHQYLRFRIDPAWLVKPEFASLNIHDLKSDMVTLLFPSRLTFEFLKSELENGSEKTFRRQNLVEWTDAEDEVQKLQFDRIVLAANIIDAGAVPLGGDLFASSDLAFSKSAYADRSCFTIFKVVKDVAYILWQETGRWRPSEKAEVIVQLFRQFSGLRVWMIEKFPTCESLEAAIQLEAMKYATSVPLYFAPIDNTANAKFHRLKNNLELPISRGAIKFVSGGVVAGTCHDWINDLFTELEKLDNTGEKRRSSSVKDDRGDSLAMGVRHFLPMPGVNDADAADRQKRAEEERSRQALAEQYSAIFGGVSRWRYGAEPGTPAPELTTRPVGVYAALDRGGFLRKPDSKPRGFGDLTAKKI